MSFDDLETGVQSSSREREATPEETLLADGSSIVTVFWPENAVVMSHEESEAARDALRNAVAEDPELVKSCQGKTVEEARKILTGYRGDTMKQAA